MDETAKDALSENQPLCGDSPASRRTGKRHNDLRRSFGKLVGSGDAADVGDAGGGDGYGAATSVAAAAPAASVANSLGVDCG